MQGLTNTTKQYSSVTLNSEWSSLWKFMILTVISSTGTFINCVFIASFSIERTLKRFGNVYLACVAVSDLIITSGVMPSAVVVIMTQANEQPTCKWLQFLTQASTSSYNLLFTMVAIENYLRFCRAQKCHQEFLSYHTGCVSFLIFLICFTVSGVGVYFRLDYDYCDRLYSGSHFFRLATSLLTLAIPFALSFLLFSMTTQVLWDRTMSLVRYRRSHYHNRDYAFVKLNFICYLVFVLAWVPYLMVTIKYSDTHDSYYYSSVWLGLSRSVVTSFLYGIYDENFRRAFGKLFNYICCKKIIRPPLRKYRRRAQEPTCRYVTDRPFIR